LNRLRFIDTQRNSDQSSHPKTVSILSGKGGVGKTVIACNLAERIASLGYRILLVDADFNFGNVHILNNVSCDYGLGAFASGRLSLKESSLRITDRLDILVSDSTHDTKDLYDVRMAAAMMKNLDQQAGEYDFVLIDHGSGKSDAATAIASASDMTIMVVVPELTSLADGYGLFKHLIQSDSRINCCLVVNRAESTDEADYVHTRFTALTERFLNSEPSYLGYLPEDQVVKESVSAQRLIANLSRDSRIIKSLADIGRSLVEELFSSTEGKQRLQETAINQNQALADIKE